jgi:protein-tyrosine-phosphatase
MKEPMMICLVLSIALSLSLPTKARVQKSERGKGPAAREQVVVFVCEHGVAKSVIAAAHFNRLARVRNLKMRAIARGTNPEDEIPSRVLTGLRADDLAPSEKPTKLSESDVVDASRVVAFCKLPDTYYKKVAVEEWDDLPPVSEDYQKARDAILRHIGRLLDQLQAKELK